MVELVLLHRSCRALTAVVSTLVLMHLSSTPALAQTQPLAEVSGEWLPFARVDALDSLSESATAQEVPAQIGSLRASANIPLSVGEQAALFVGASYGLLVVDEDGASRFVPDPAILHAVAGSLLFSADIVENWRLTIRCELSLAGDFADVGTDHIRLSGASFLSHEFSAELVLGVGALATWRFGELLPVPALQIRWRILEELRLEALLPVQAALTWRLDERVELGLSASIDGQLYSITSTRDRWPCSAEDVDRLDTLEFDESRARPDQCAARLAFSRGEVGPTLALGIAGPLWLSIHAGLVFLLRSQAFAVEESASSPRTLSANVGASVQMRLTLRFPEQ